LPGLDRPPRRFAPDELYGGEPVADRRQTRDRSQQALPDQFVVRFTPAGDLAMVCKVVWSRDGAVGLRFIGRVGDNAPAVG
jgi:hypothetical protein